MLLGGGYIVAGVVVHGLHIEQGPGVPRLGPARRCLRGKLQAAQHAADDVLRQILQRNGATAVSPAQRRSSKYT